jgi:formylglycine-generating enzyme required for sulfatase activity
VSDTEWGAGGREKNSIGQTLVEIPAGRFTMGALSPAEFQKLADRFGPPGSQPYLECLMLLPPSVEVTIPKSFCMTAHEVTIAQFRQFVHETQYRTDAERSGQGGTGRLPNGKWSQSVTFDWNTYGFDVTDDHPVANVSWNDAVAFCRWLSQTEGRHYRLPTEQEWEYACRAGTDTLFSTGDDPSTLAGHANVADQSLLAKESQLPWAAKHNDTYAFLAPVGQFAPNAYGLHDMHGNVMEWCSSSFSAMDPLTRAHGTGVPNSPKELQQGHVLRGGNWFNNPARAGSPSRSGANASHCMSLIGFRVVCEVTPDNLETPHPARPTNP